MTKVALQEHQVEVRKALWSAVKALYERMAVSFNMTPIPVTNQACGLVVYEDDRGVYCDGRSEPVWVASELETRQRILFLPFVEKNKNAA